VRAAGRHVQRDLCVAVQAEALGVPVGRRARPKVGNHVEDRPGGAAHQLRLAVAAAQVQTADHAAGRPGHAVLHERGGIQARLAQHVGVGGTAEEAPLVTTGHRLEQ
jgi:hypothetical protein